MNEKKMEAKIVDPRDLLQAQISYQIPQFQTPYAWEEDVQWRPLWEDVCIVAERFLNKEDDEKVRSHLWEPSICNSNKTSLWLSRYQFMA